MIPGRVQNIHEQNEKNKAEQQRRDLPLNKSTETKALHSSNSSHNYSARNDNPRVGKAGGIEKL